MSEFIIYLKTKIDEYISSQEENSQDVNAIKPLVSCLQSIINNENYDPSKLEVSVNENSKILSDDELAIIKYFIVIGNINKSSDNKMTIDVTQSKILNNIIIRLNDLYDKQNSKGFLIELKNSLNGDVHNMNIELLPRAFEILNIPYEQQCYILIELLNSSYVR